MRGVGAARHSRYFAPAASMEVSMPRDSAESPKPARHRTEAAVETNVLVFQGGGALGAYQAGAYARLSAAGIEPGWIAGISIGAINAAILAGNPAEAREEKLRGFWEKITAGLPGFISPSFVFPRQIFAEISSYLVMARGAPGFFTPNLVPPFLMPDGTAGALAWNDTSPLEATLEEFVDFKWLNAQGPRLSLGAVDVETGNFDYFDSTEIPITPRHVMASGALPPGFPPVEIGGRLYWDGGLVSNTPLQYVLDEADGTPLCVFQLDLFPARGSRPQTIFDVARREKDIRYSSRTRLTTDRYRQLGEIAAAGRRLAKKLGPDWAEDADLKALCGSGQFGAVTLVHLIQRRGVYEAYSKDYEFSRHTMVERWAAGERDVERLLTMPEWVKRPKGRRGLTILDPGAEGRGRMRATDEPE
jgi:NTE family protein